MHFKDFETWNIEKIGIDKRNHHPYCNEREIWWCSLGINVGVEVDGKNGKFERPSLILKYINKDIVLVIPLTSKQKSDVNHCKITTVNRVSFAKISQIRVISTKRLLRKINTLEIGEFNRVKDMLFKFLS